MKIALTMRDYVCSHTNYTITTSLALFFMSHLIFTKFKQAVNA